MSDGQSPDLYEIRPVLSGMEAKLWKCIGQGNAQEEVEAKTSEAIRSEVVEIMLGSLFRDGKALPTEERTESLKQFATDAQVLLSAGKYEEPWSLPNEEAGMPYASNRVVAQVKERLGWGGVDSDELDLERLFFGKKLAEALYHTLVMLKEIDPKIPQSKIATLGSRANYEWSDFFMKSHQKLKLSFEELNCLYKNIFLNPNMSRMFKAKGMGRFPFGVRGLLAVYRVVDEQHKGAAVIQPVCPEDDRKGWGDVRAEIRGIEKRYEIKNVTGDSVPNAPMLMFNIRSSKARRVFEEGNWHRASQRQVTRWQSSWHELEENVGSKPNVEGFFVLVNSEAVLGLEERR
jgi:hypothetical protein